MNCVWLSTAVSSDPIDKCCFIFQAFVLLVIGLTTSVVVIYYAFLLPVILQYSTPWVVFHLVIAHWLLINIVFHYFKVVFTSPGRVPQVIYYSLGWDFLRPGQMVTQFNTSYEMPFCIQNYFTAFHCILLLHMAKSNKTILRAT